MNYSYKEIEKKIEKSHNSEVEMWKWINLYIKKSKKENNNETLIYAYREASNNTNLPNNFKYSILSPKIQPQLSGFKLVC